MDRNTGISSISLDATACLFLFFLLLSAMICFFGSFLMLIYLGVFFYVNGHPLKSGHFSSLSVFKNETKKTEWRLEYMGRMSSLMPCYSRGTSGIGFI